MVNDKSKWPSKVFNNEWDICTNFASDHFLFSFDARFFHTAYEASDPSAAIAYVVSADARGKQWHVATLVGRKGELFFRTDEPIAERDIWRWLCIRGFKLPGSQWQRSVLNPPDYSPPCPDAESVVNIQPGAVYFIRDPEKQRIKIGYSTHPQRRFKRIRLMSSTLLELLGQIPSPKWFERVLHRSFAEVREHGEWFQESDELLKLIRQNATAAD